MALLDNTETSNSLSYVQKTQVSEEKEEHCSSRSGGSANFAV
jgi:hypothetical protein